MIEWYLITGCVLAIFSWVCSHWSWFGRRGVDLATMLACILLWPLAVGAIGWIFLSRK